MSSSALDWYKKGRWFHKPGYWYRHVDSEKGQYLACGTYPGCVRGCESLLFTELMKQGYKMATEKDIVLSHGFRPSKWIVPITDGSVGFHGLWEHILKNCEFVDSVLDNPLCVRKYYESK